MKAPLSVKKNGQKIRPPRSFSPAIRPRCADTGKVIWESKKIAKHQAKAYRKDRGDKMSAYECDKCQGWHIGHRAYHKQKQKAIRQQANNQLPLTHKRGIAAERHSATVCNDSILFHSSPGFSLSQWD